MPDGHILPLLKAHLTFPTFRVGDGGAEWGNFPSFSTSLHGGFFLLTGSKVIQCYNLQSSQFIAQTAASIVKQCSVLQITCFDTVSNISSNQC